MYLKRLYSHLNKLSKQYRYWLLLAYPFVALLLSLPLFKFYQAPKDNKSLVDKAKWSAPAGNHPVYKHARYVDGALSVIHKPLREVSKSQERPRGVAELKDVFNDLNPEQLATAELLGIKPISDRRASISLEDKLEDISSLSNLCMSDQMTHSVPLLIPRAARLISSIAKSFQDSLLVKGYPRYDLVVTSVLRTEEDLSRLRRFNGNASANSCHRYGTTFDITYRRFFDPRQRIDVEEEALKNILAEVLRDYHAKQLCYIKYEYKQACFHITCR